VSQDDRSENNDTIGAIFEFPPDTLKVGWNVSVSNPSSYVIKSDSDDYRAFRFLSVPVQINVFDGRGQPVRQFNKPLNISLFIYDENNRSDGDDKSCFAYNSDEYDQDQGEGWKCYGDYDSQSTRTKRVWYATTTSNHLTSFAVLLGSPVGFGGSNGGLDWISIASVAMIGSMLPFVTLIVVLYYLSESFRAIVGGWEAHRSITAIEGRLADWSSSRSLERI